MVQTSQNIENDGHNSERMSQAEGENVRQASQFSTPKPPAINLGNSSQPSEDSGSGTEFEWGDRSPIDPKANDIIPTNFRDLPKASSTKPQPGSHGMKRRSLSSSASRSESPPPNKERYSHSLRHRILKVEIRAEDLRSRVLDALIAHGKTQTGRKPSKKSRDELLPRLYEYSFRGVTIAERIVVVRLALEDWLHRATQIREKHNVEQEKKAVDEYHRHVLAGADFSQHDEIDALQAALEHLDVILEEIG